MSMREISIDGQHIRAEAGVLMTMLSKTALERDSQDLNGQFLSRNSRRCGSWKCRLFWRRNKDYLVEIELLVNGKVVRYTKDQLFLGIGIENKAFV